MSDYLPSRRPYLRRAPQDERCRGGRSGADFNVSIDDLPVSLRERLAVTDGHWLWTGQINNRGYGAKHAAYIDPDRPAQKRPVHVLAWEALIGPVADDMELDHLCEFTTCANPYCLEEVTGAENQRRASDRQESCRRAGHPLTPENTYVDPHGDIRCRACARQLDRTRVPRRRAAR